MLACRRLQKEEEKAMKNQTLQRRLEAVQIVILRREKKKHNIAKFIIDQYLVIVNVSVYR